MTHMTRRTATGIGASVAALCVVAQAVAALLMRTTEQGWDIGSAFLLGYAVVGAVIVARKPRNTIGWLLVVCSAAITLGLLCAAIVYATLDPQPAFWQRVLAWVTNNMFIPGFEGLLVALAFLFPTGRPLSPRWRTAGLVVGILFAAHMIIPALRPGPLGAYWTDTPELTNHFGIPGVDALSRHVSVLALPTGIFIVLTCLWAVVARVRRANGIERLQLQWLALVLGTFAVLLLAEVLSRPYVPAWVSLAVEAAYFAAATLGIAVAIGIAILRYQLYDIDRLVNRGLVYLALTATLVLVYLGLVLVLGSVVRSLTGASSSIVTAASTLAVAALFTPLRASIQRVVDRRFYRRKYDAARTIENLSARLRDEVDLAALSLELQAVVRESMQPAHVSLWLRPVVRR